MKDQSMTTKRLQRHHHAINLERVISGWPEMFDCLTLTGDDERVGGLQATTL